MRRTLLSNVALPSARLASSRAAWCALGHLPESRPPAPSRARLSSSLKRRCGPASIAAGNSLATSAAHNSISAGCSGRGCSNCSCVPAMKLRQSISDLSKSSCGAWSQSIPTIVLDEITRTRKAYAVTTRGSAPGRTSPASATARVTRSWAFGMSPACAIASASRKVDQFIEFTAHRRGSRRPNRGGETRLCGWPPGPARRGGCALPGSRATGLVEN